MELPQEIFIVILRVVTILPLLLFVTLFMGKRTIGEIPVFDFLIIITLASVTGADIADPNVQHFHTVVAIIAIAVLQRLISYLATKYRAFGRKVTFEPTVVIKDGSLIYHNLQSIRFTIDNILQMLREKGFFNLSEVKLGIVEANGKLSIHKKNEKSEITIEDLIIKKKSSSLAYPIIIEGKVHSDVLKRLGKDVKWLHYELLNRNISKTEEVLFASLNDAGEIHLSLKNEKESGPLFYH
ncbi:DUF421 domain-containing protein [Bacillus shivajii]|uniref:DUF421 domain-containing protein n=1 Tax=Bacillus shivajii TaxID=1983719 RepID=UPI001CFA266C|nr:DUF421 domain-containing protein [Bacillus shivajii]UCZ54717.1 DUF421 domain-containing protein [Bacillus shivajii]